MVLMSLIDGVILGIVLIVVGLLIYHLFIKKNRNYCSGCALMTKAKRRNKKLSRLAKKR